MKSGGSNLNSSFIYKNFDFSEIKPLSYVITVFVSGLWVKVISGVHSVACSQYGLLCCVAV
jgi:uncharacterized membrane protein